MLYHLGDAATTQHPVFARLTSIGACGVDVFFVISGFIMVHTTRGSSCTPGSFLARRLQRVAPPYWFITIVTFLALCAGFEPIGNHHVDWGYLLASLAFIPVSREGGAIMPLLGVGWTLNYEMLFYLTFALALRWRRFAPPGLLVAVPIAILATLGFAFSFSNPIVRTFTAPLMLEFLFGTGLGVAWQFVGATQPSRRWLILAAGLTALGICLLVTLFDPTHLVGEQSKWRWLTIGMPAALIVAGALLAEKAGFAVNHEAILYQGETSYSLYLTHTLVLQVATKVFRPLGVQQYFALELLLDVAVCAFAAAVFHRWFEKRLVAFAKTAFSTPSATASIS